MTVRLLALCFAPVAVAFGTVANAACSRADVDHFLSRGFTQEQIVLLCGGSMKEADEPLVQEATEAERELRDLLLRAVDARRVDVGADHLEWQSEQCVEFAAPNLAGRPRERCGMVTRRVGRDQFTVGEIRRQVLFFGEHGVELKGVISQVWDIKTDGMMSADIRRLQENTPETTDSALLPLHGKADPDEIAGALQRWSATP